MGGAAFYYTLFIVFNGYIPGHSKDCCTSLGRHFGFAGGAGTGCKSSSSLSSLKQSNIADFGFNKEDEDGLYG